MTHLTHAQVLQQIDRIESDMAAEWGVAGERRMALAAEEFMAHREWEVMPRWEKKVRIAVERIAWWWADFRFFNRG